MFMMTAMANNRNLATSPSILSPINYGDAGDYGIYELHPYRDSGYHASGGSKKAKKKQPKGKAKSTAAASQPIGGAKAAKAGASVHGRWRRDNMAVRQGSYVCHDALGLGVVTRASAAELVVWLGRGRTRRYARPDCFQQYLTLEERPGA